jgi:hypothetical protein
MSANMTTAFNMETTGLVELLLQQKGSILRQHISTLRPIAYAIAIMYSLVGSTKV